MCFSCCFGKQHVSTVFWPEYLLLVRSFPSRFGRTFVVHSAYVWRRTCCYGIRFVVSARTGQLCRTATPWTTNAFLCSWENSGPWSTARKRITSLLGTRYCSEVFFFLKYLQRVVVTYHTGSCCNSYPLQLPMKCTLIQMFLFIYRMVMVLLYKTKRSSVTFSQNTSSTIILWVLFDNYTYVRLMFLILLVVIKCFSIQPICCDTLSK